MMPVRDESGRIIAPDQTEIAPRPMGPWATNHDNTKSWHQHVAEKHAEVYPDGCPRLCEACIARLRRES